MRPTSSSGSRAPDAHGDVTLSYGPRPEEEAELAQRLVGILSPLVDDAAPTEADGPHR